MSIAAAQAEAKLGLIIFSLARINLISKRVVSLVTVHY